MHSNLGERETDILQFFIKNRDKDLTLDTLIKNFHFNCTNLKNSLLKIDNFLISNSLAPLKKEGKNFILKESHFEEISSILYSNFIPSKSDRITYLLFMLLTENTVSLTEVSIFFNLNRKSLQLDLQDIKKLVEEYRLDIISKNAKGISLEGNLLAKYGLFINLLLRILLKRDNPLQQKIYSQICSTQDRLEILKLIEILSKKSQTSFSLGTYYGIFSTFLINRNFSHIFPTVELGEKLSEFNLSVSKDIFFELNELNIPELTECAKVLGIIFTKIDSKKSLEYPFFKEKSHFFVTLLEKSLGIIPSEEKNILLNMLDFSVFRKNFMLDFYEDEMLFFDDSLSKLLSETCIKVDLDIYSHDFQKIYFFLKSSINLKEFICKNSTPTKILIIDGSMKNWMGNAIKKSVAERYYTDEIDVVNYLDHSFQEIDKTYSLILKIETPPTFFESVPELSWKAFLRNPEYMGFFNLCKK